MIQKLRYLYDADQKHFIKSISLGETDEIPENSTIVPPKITNLIFYYDQIEARFFDRVPVIYHPAQGVKAPIISDPYLPDVFGMDPTYQVVFINNYWDGSEWEIRNTPLALSIAQENEIVKSLLADFFLVQKDGREQGRDKDYYILLHKKSGYATLVSEDDKEWSKELYYADVMSVIDFVDYKFEQSENNMPPDGNVYYYKINSDKSYGGYISAPLNYGENRRPNIDPENMTEVIPPFDLKPPFYSTYFYWNGSAWEIRNIDLALDRLRKCKIASDMVRNDGFVLVNIEKSYYKGFRVGYWYILWRKDVEYTLVHTMDKKWFEEKCSTYEHALYEIALIEHDVVNGNPDEPITAEELEDSKARWEQYLENEKKTLVSNIDSEKETLSTSIEEEWNEKVYINDDLGKYYIEEMKKLVDRNFEEDKFFYYVKTKIERRINMYVS